MEKTRPGGNSLRATKAVIRRDTKTMSEILSRWRDMMVQGDEISTLLAESAQQVYEQCKQFLPTEDD